MIKKTILLLLLAGFLAACGQAESETVNNDSGTETEVPEIITADLAVPEEVAAGEQVTFQVTVKQGSELVEDAEEIQFEFWQTDTKDNSEKVTAVAEGSGVYTVKKAFSEPGEYHVQSHVVARSMHVMPVKVFTVGE